MFECPLCGDGRSRNKTFCVKCSREHGTISKLWPRWVQEIVAMQRRFERQVGGVVGAPAGEIKLASFYDGVETWPSGG
ncbi:MAG: hypothetical protein H8D74_02560 [Chloroflexi bacterium]|nr:hypothetical protein [Chloroflexota bacterium]